MVISKMSLKGKAGIVTGGARGIGFAISKKLLEEGTKVALFDINEEELTSAGQKLEAFNESLLGIRGDVSSRHDVQRLLQNVLESFGEIYFLVNNAGISPKKEGKKVPLVDMDANQWEKVLAVNLTGAFNCCQAVLPYLISQKAGKIVNVASVDAKTGGFDVGAHYAASKAGLVALTKSLSREVAIYNINVNAIAPGCINTELFRSRLPSTIDYYIKQIPLGRAGEPEEVADATVFLLSEASSYITGATLDINGGWFTF
jgi:3-oxoacyl-[acyl-carrier protein] reductase